MLGGIGGDYQNLISGSPTGTLCAGTRYALTYSTFLSTPTALTQGATATGFLTLSFIPEPSTGVLMMTGLLGLAYRQRRQRRAA